MGRHWPLALEDPNRHCVLVVIRGGENLALLGGNGGVALDERREHAAKGLDAQRQGRDVQE